MAQPVGAEASEGFRFAQPTLRMAQPVGAEAGDGFRFAQPILRRGAGTEAVVVCKDVLQLSDADARKMKRWAIRALIEAARKT